ncbi:MAG: hypothetical protein ACRDQZ_18525, partial [Mycobacteriales bacterium]
MGTLDQTLRSLHPPTAEPVTRAYVNRGRWIVECQCREAHEARPGLKRWKCMMDVPNQRTGTVEHVGCGSEYTV